ncbi:MAG: hypothetical protein J1F64_07650 [Oscillospiraceae bacterium]|nr:hypothetical protein [Oscillospiraceae bacterium]
MNVDKRYSTILFIGGLTGILHSLVIEAGIKPLALYVVGETQSRKTTLVRECTRMYNRSDIASSTETARVSSTKLVLEKMIDELSDATFILDDMYREKDAGTRKDYEGHIRNIIRNLADDSPRNTQRSSYRVNSQVIITGEYLLDNRTDIGRCFIIHIDNPISGKRLNEIQKNPLILPTFYRNFIKYICRYYYETEDFIKSSFREFRINNELCQVKYKRIQEERFLLICILKIFCNYAVYVGELDKNSASIMIQEVKEQIDNAVKFQEEIMRNLEIKEQKNINLSLLLLKCIGNNDIKTGEKNSGCFKKGKHIFIRCEILVISLYNCYGLEYSAIKISKYFANKGISYTYNNRNVVKIRE